MGLRIPGGGVGFEGNTSSGTTLKLRLGAAGVIGLQVGTDFVPMHTRIIFSTRPEFFICF